MFQFDLDSNAKLVLIGTHNTFFFFFRRRNSDTTLFVHTLANYLNLPCKSNEQLIDHIKASTCSHNPGIIVFFFCVSSFFLFSFTS